MILQISPVYYIICLYRFRLTGEEEAQMILRKGLTGTASRTVADTDTALAVGSGSLPVCATPVLSAVMEAAAVDAVKGCLPSSATTVGISLTLRHTSTTTVGHTVTARAELIETEGRLLTFRITATDEAGEVGCAEHVRCLIESAPFMEKAEKKYRK